MDKNKIAEKIVNDIIKDILDRRGLKQEFQAIDDDIQEEIKTTWKNIIIKNI
jgi:precorrin-2 methylase